jgi:hypothetical protein
MWPITIAPTRLAWIVKQTRPLPGRSTRRAEPLPPSAFGTSLCPRPHRIVVHLGQTVRRSNHDPVVHTVASSQLRLASEGIGPGKTFTYTPKRRGTFAYFCTIHAHQTGVLVVQ